MIAAGQTPFPDMTSATDSDRFAAPGSSLEKLFAGLYGEAPAGQPAVADADLARALAGGDLRQDLAIHARAVLKGVSLAPQQVGRIRAASAIMLDFFHQPLFHPELADRLQAGAGSLVAAAFSRDSWLARKQHPLVSALDELADFASGWYPAHPQADDIASMLGNTLARLHDDTLDEEMAVFRQWRSQFSQRTAKVAERVLQAERGTLRTQYARGLAARTINRQVAGRPVPVPFARVLETVWLPAFQWVLLDQGDKGPLWSSLVRTFSLLVWSLQESALEQKPKFQRVVEQLRHDLPALLAELFKDERQREQLYEDIQLIHLCRLHERPVEYELPPLLEGTSALDALDADVSADLIREVASISTTQWFVLAGTGMRMQLHHRDDDHQQLLFLNQLGMKALACSFEEFVLQYSSGMIQPVAEVQSLSEWTQAHLQRLADQYRARAREQREVQQKLAEQEAMQKAEKVAELEKRALSREKARVEAERLQQEKLAALGGATSGAGSEAEIELARREGAAAALGSSPAQRRQRARLLVMSLSVGTWMNFHSDNGMVARRKLAVMLPSSNKYIFVDRVGADKVQLSRDELVDAVASGAVDPLQKDSRFDDALTRLAGDLSRGK